MFRRKPLPSYMIHIQSFTFNPFQENTYVLYNEHNEAIIIDPGMYEAYEFARFFNFIDSKELSPVLLLNTHTHLDHIFGNAAVVEKYKIPYAFHEADKPVFDAAPGAGALYNMPFEPSPQPDFYISEQDVITLGDEILSIKLAPGHSPGSVCFYNADYKFVISGDVLFNMSVGRSDLPGGNTDDLIRSIQTQLYSLPDDTAVYSGHGPVTHIGIEKMNNPFVRSI